MSLWSIAAPASALLLAGGRAVQATASDDPASVSAKPASDWKTPLIGRLRNGVRFAILSRRGSEPGVALLMRNEGGFIAERRPGERGLAHLIEHIVFHSPVVDAPDDFDHLKRLGMPLTLPAPTAGSTSWRETNYHLSTINAAPKDLDVLLGLLRDAATNMTFRTDAVDASRGEVVREMADKKSSNDIYARYIAAVAPGSPNDVIDAQNSADVPEASIDAIRALYHRLYQPRNMMIVVVGNVDTAAVRTLIEKRFGNWKPAAPAFRATRIPTFQRNHIRPISFSALPQARRVVLMSVVMPTPSASSSRGDQMRAELMDLLVALAVNDRLHTLQLDSPAGKIGMFIENGDQGHRQIMVWDSYGGDQWQSAVAGLKGAMCTLRSDGFTGEEWARAKQNLLSDLEHRAAEMPGMSNVELAKDLSHAVADGRSLIPPDERLHHARAVLPTIDVRLGNKWWRRQWESGVVHLRVEAPELGSVADPIAAIRVAAKGADTLCTRR